MKPEPEPSDLEKLAEWLECLLAEQLSTKPAGDYRLIVTGTTTLDEEWVSS